MEKRSFEPDWALPPGAIVEDVLEERGIIQVELASRMGVSKKFVNDLIRGRASISSETAESLALVLGSTSGFWLRLQANYDADVARLARDKRHEAEHKDWVRQFPYAELIKWGWVEERTSVAQQVRMLLEFFGVATPEAWSANYAEKIHAFRTSPTYADSLGATTAWLRRAEIEAQSATVPGFDRVKFQRLLPGLRSLSRGEEFQAAWTELTNACAECGVVVLLVPAPKGCRASGATFFMGGDRAVLVLSGRYRDDGHVWFTFFHEAGHLVLHSRQLTFVEGVEGLNEDQESDADAFARDLLIPPAFAPHLASLRTQADVTRFAEEIGIAAGIVVGRLQHDGHIGRDRLNGLKRRFEWRRGEVGGE